MNKLHPALVSILLFAGVCPSSGIREPPHPPPEAGATTTVTDVYAPEFSSDGRYVAAIAYPQGVVTWRIPNGEVQNCIAMGETPYGVGLLGRRVVVAIHEQNGPGRLEYRRLSDGSILLSEAVQNQFRRFDYRWLEYNHYLVFGATTRDITLLDAATGTGRSLRLPIELSNIRRDTRPRRTFCISSSANCVVCEGPDTTSTPPGTVKVWYSLLTRTGFAPFVCLGQTNDRINWWNRVSADEDGDRVSAVGADSTSVIVWTTRDGASAEIRVSGGLSTPIDCAALAPNGAVIAVAQRDRTVGLYSVAARRLIAVRGFTDPVPTTGPHACSSIRFSPDGRRLFVGYTNGNAYLWEIGSGEVTQLKTNGIWPVNAPPGLSLW
ncbi:MAG: WD40 repeat domain-containing protein [Capsulimonadaceae bacterium]